VPLRPVAAALAEIGPGPGGPSPRSGDEDAFTLAVSALEAVLEGPAASGPSAEGVLRLAGRLPGGSAELLGAALGRGFRIEPLDLAELDSAWADESGSNLPSSAWVVLAEERDPPAALALRWSAGDVAASGPAWGAGAGGAPPPDARFRRLLERLPLVPLFRRRSNPSTAGAPPGAAAMDLAAALGQVSEGAYVPRTRYLENLPSRWRFVAELCPQCHGVTFPVRGFCRHCGAVEGLRREELPRAGRRVVAATTIHPGAQPSEFDWRVETAGPYDVLIVELAEGARVTLQLTDAAPGSIGPDDLVDTVLRRLYPMEGEWRYGRKAVPAGQADGPGAAPGRSGGGVHGASSQPW
jgi:uncharacterized OB-fold protein